MRRGVRALFALLGAMGCGDELAREEAHDAGAPGELTVARVLPWPGGGLQIDVEWPRDVWPVASIETAGSEAPAAVAEPGPAVGITAVLVVPAEDAAEHAARIAAATALADALPEGEQIALLAAGDEAVLLVDLTASRARLHAALAALAPAAGAAAPLMASLRDAVAALESRFTARARAIAVVGEEVAETEPGLLRPVQTVSLAVGDDPAADGAALAAQLAARRAAVVRVGACPGLATADPFTLRAGDAATPLLAPEPMAHLAGVACDAAAAAADDFPFPDEIAFEFTAEERAIYDERVSGFDDTPFRGSVRLGDGTLLPADLRTRGQASLSCERKSFAVELDGARRRLGPALASDRFLLISMCLDLRYFGQLFGDRLLADLGLFPARLRYVRLRIDGENRGVYLLIERPERAFRDASLALASVIRRGYEPFGAPPEVEYPDEPPDAVAAAQADFEALGDLAMTGPVETLEAALDERLELDRYLDMIALYSLLENGDFIDEAFFAASAEAGGARYRTMGWDTDDLFSPCHAGGANALVDACGVLYCAEANLDHAIVRSPAVYQRYLDALARMLDRHSADRLVAAMNDVKRELWAAIDSDETAAALTEMVAQNPAAATVAGARADIASWMDWALDHIEARRAALDELLTACTSDSRATRSGRPRRRR